MTDNPLIVAPNEMTTANNILVGSTLARKKRPGQSYFSTDGSDANASYPVNPKNNGGSDGSAILGLYEFWRYEVGVPTSTTLVRQGTKIWAISGRTGLATDITGSLTLPTTGKVTFQAFEGNVYWVSTNETEGYNKWDGVSATAVALVNIGAAFLAAVPGVTGTVDITADNLGNIGNLVTLNGDGVKTLATLVSDWNTANPSNTITLNSANGGDTPNNLEVIGLIGGQNKIPPDGTPRYLVSHNGRMFSFGVPGFPYRLYYTEFYDAENWATNPLGTTGTVGQAGSLDFDPFGDPTGIVGAVSFQNKIYVFMNRSSFRVIGFSINDFAVETINQHIGCVGHHTIIPIENDVIYASERGILKLSSTDKAVESDYAFLSRPISRLWNESLNRSVESQYHAAYDLQENLYLLSCTSAGNTTNDIILALNVQNNVWTTWEGHKARCLTTFIDTDGVRRVMYGREDGVISLTDPTNRLDLGQPFSASFRSGILFPGEEMDIEHIFKTATILASTDGTGKLVINMFVDSKLANSETLEVESGKELLGSSFVLGQSRLGNGVFVPQTYRIGDKGYGLQIEVIFNTEDDVEVYGFMVDAAAADHRIGGAS